MPALTVIVPVNAFVMATPWLKYALPSPSFTMDVKIDNGRES